MTQDDLVPVARILGLIASPPNLRYDPQPGDLQGTFDFWFDGGASYWPTGGVRCYEFSDGAKASMGRAKQPLRVRVRLPDGRSYVLEQE